jgi:hypothetical protein
VMIQLVREIGPHEGAGVGVQDQWAARSAASASLTAVPLPLVALNTS